MNAGAKALTVAEWGEQLGISATSAWRKVRDGQVTVVNVGSPKRPRLRVTPEAHAAYVKRHEIKGRAA